jgi:hypothetical protein
MVPTIPGDAALGAMASIDIARVAERATCP